MRELAFDNTFVRELPGDAEEGERVRQVLGAFYSFVKPTAVASPRVVAWSADVAQTLGLDAIDMESPALAQVLGGNALLDGMQPFATNYGGHQFGVWADQLGDGRAISLGEVVAGSGERWELQLGRMVARKGVDNTGYPKWLHFNSTMSSSATAPARTHCRSCTA